MISEVFSILNDCDLNASPGLSILHKRPEGGKFSDDFAHHTSVKYISQEFNPKKKQMYDV